MKKLFLFMIAIPVFGFLQSCNNATCSSTPTVVNYTVVDQPQNESDNIVDCEKNVNVCFCNTINGADRTIWEAVLLRDGASFIASLSKEQSGNTEEWQGRWKIKDEDFVPGIYQIRIYEFGTNFTNLRQTETFTISCSE